MKVSGRHPIDTCQEDIPLAQGGGVVFVKRRNAGVKLVGEEVQP